MAPHRSVVVTGGARGVGAGISRALRERGWAVIVLDLTGGDVNGDAGDPAVAEAAAQAAIALAPLHGWVNNAADFTDARVHEQPERVLATIASNLVPAVVGTSVATRHFLESGVAGAIVNVSSHQATSSSRRRAALRDGEGRDRGAHESDGGGLRAHGGSEPMRSRSARSRRSGSTSPCARVWSRCIHSDASGDRTKWETSSLTSSRTRRRS